MFKKTIGDEQGEDFDSYKRDCTCPSVLSLKKLIDDNQGLMSEKCPVHSKLIKVFMEPSLEEVLNWPA